MIRLYCSKIEAKIDGPSFTTIYEEDFVSVDLHCLDSRDNNYLKSW